MKRKPIQAKELVSVGYSVDEQILEVEFRDGSIYQIHEVTAEVYEYVMNGGYFRDDYFAEHLMIENLCRQVYPAMR